MESYNYDTSAVEAPRPPRRFKTAFIFFSSARHKELKEQLAAQGKTEKTTTIAKALSKEWREMKPEERAVWDEKSKEDKARYEAEMANYKQQQKLNNSAPSKKARKDPDAPKRPMSAFLAFSNKRRAALKRQNPDATNADLSKMLSKSWKEATPEFKAEYIEEEARKRAQYKVDILSWRKKKSEEIRSNLGSKKVNTTAAVPRGKKTAAQSAPQQGPVAGFQYGQQAMLGALGGPGGQLGTQQQTQQLHQQPAFFTGGFQGNNFQAGVNPAMYQSFQMHPQFGVQTQQQQSMIGAGQSYGQQNFQPGIQQGLPSGFQQGLSQGLQQGMSQMGNAGFSSNPYAMMNFSSGMDGLTGQDNSLGMFMHQQQPGAQQD